MNAYEYLQALRQALAVLPEEEINSAMRYYEDYFLDAGDQNAARVIEALGDPQQVAQNILDNYTDLARRRPPQAEESQTVPPKTEKKQDKKWRGINPWVLAVLVLLALPLAIPLALTALALIVAAVVLVVVMPCAILVGLATIPIALGGAGLFLCFFSLFLFHFPASVLATFGIGLILLASAIFLGILIFQLFRWLLPHIVHLLSVSLRWVVSKIRGVLS